MLAPRVIPSQATAKASPATSSRAARWLRRTALGLAIFVVVLALVGFFVVPAVVKHQVEKLGSAELDRQVRVEAVTFNPFTLEARATGITVSDKSGPRPMLAIDEVFVDLSLKSVVHFAPVVKRLKVTRPVASVIRLDGSRYNFSDIVDRQLAKPPPAKEQAPARFALFNLELVDGRIDFDDRPEELQHAVTAIGLGVPFISSFPVDIDVGVQPKLEAVVNGDPLRIVAETKPFKDTLETTADLDYTDIDLARYVAYSPVDLRFRVPSGKLDTKLHVVFATKGGKPATLTIGGTAAVRDLALQHTDGTPALAVKTLSAAIERAEVIEQQVALSSVRIDAPALHVLRRSDGSLDLLDLMPASPAPVPGAARATPAKPWQFRVGEIVLTGGRADVEDRVAQPAVKVALAPVEVTVKGLGNAPGTEAEVALTALADFGAKIEHRGLLSLAPAAAHGHLAVTGLPIAKLEPYYSPYVTFKVADGNLDLAADYTTGEANGPIAPKLSNLSLALAQLRIVTPGVKEPLWRVPRMAVNGASVDLSRRQVTIAEATLADAVGYVLRTRDGKTQYDGIVKAGAVPVAPARTAAASAEPAWTVDATRLHASNAALTFEDRVPAHRVVTRVTRLDLAIDGASSAKGGNATVAMRGTINQRGTFDVKGPVTATPPKGRLTVRTRGVSLVPFQAYVDDKVNVTLNAGSLSNAGTVAFDAAPGKPLALSYQGDVTVSDLAAVTKPAMQDLLRWKSAQIEGLRFTLQPLKADVEAVALDDFFARLILNPDGVFNFQQLTGEPPPPTPVAMPAAAPVAPPARKSIETTARATAAGALPTNIRLGKITFANGNVNFSDFYIKPNYTANLTGVSGTVTEMTPDKPGDLAIRAKIDDAAPVVIDGRVNALSPSLFLDIKASAKDIELPPLSPYSAKYAGYGIEKGKLSVTVKYLVENRTLAAENNVYLDQLTFGERVESPTATKLPVLLAVALLKDRNGVIDINLPISGSLDDPQFSVGGLIVRVIVNLITKAITAPFALIGAAFGGGPELSFVEFAAGTAVLDDTAIKRLDALGKALDSRPGLRLEVSGRVDPVPDREALKIASVQRKVKAQKLRALSREGTETASPDAVVVDKTEYEEYLKRAYRAEKFDKPRNVFGFAKDIPAAEMEKLMLANTQVSDEDLRVLANQRAQAAKAYLVDKGHVASDRIFLVTPGLDAAGVKEGKPTRVDFSLKN